MDVLYCFFFYAKNLSIFIVIMNIDKFTDRFLEKEITNIVIPSMFTNLDRDDVNILANYVIKLLNIISICFCFNLDLHDDYVYQLKQNNYQDIKWLIYHVLPYINGNSDLSRLYYLSDIYTKKIQNVNINEVEPQYVYSNLQYNRFVRNVDNYREREFAISDLDNNYYLLIESIRMTSNKLCLNWINILPYTMNDYSKSQLYLKTRNNYIYKKISYWNPLNDANLSLSNKNVYDNVLRNNSGLYVGHIYEEIADLYYSVKSWKWILYSVQIQGESKTVIDLLSVLFNNANFNVSTFLELPKWDDLTNERKKYFEDINARIAKILIEKNNFNLFDTYYTFVRSFILDFENTAYKYQAMKEKYTKLSNEEINDNNENFSEMSVIKSFVSLKEKYIYEYIAESLQRLKQTWYGYMTFSEDKTKIDEDQNITEKFKFIGTLNDDEIVWENENPQSAKERGAINYLKQLKQNNMFDFPLQLKNVYNFAKSMCHSHEEKDKKKIFYAFPKCWCSLTIEQKKIVISRLNGQVKPLSWFDISRNIERDRIGVERDKFLGTLNDQDPNERAIKTKTINFIIYYVMKRLIIDIVFQSLIHKGVLTQFIPNKHTSEKSRLRDESFDNISEVQTQKDILAERDSNKYWTSAYHYLTMNRYKDMKPYMYDGKERTYFSYALDKKWFAVGAYDWMGQIGFCHHFINNRVIFLTAPTGIGKSIEIPKLYLYYSKVIDCNQSPTIACTQPRKVPVEGAGYVAATLGVPIRIKKDEPVTENYFIQFQHESRSHVKNVNQPVLRYMTGDTLLYQINDPLLKKEIDEEYSVDNKYDMIIIDESHEHVTYMDLLLSYLKLSLTMNNSLRLIIVTATMDDDEYRYRRFYRDINDNRKYPLNTFIRDNQLDRINVDRRCHVAIPGATTKYTINEWYRPVGKDDVNAEDQIIVKIINEILNKATTGNILIFEPGEADINRIVELLNKTTRANVIALPFYRELPQDKQDVITKIDVKKKEVKMDKSLPFATSDYKTGTNKYDMFIIVATSIAEASITIPELKFVIDTGTIKKPVYDYKKKNVRLLKTDISESSRLQRKGRVGRTSSGEAYYLYEKDRMKNNRIQYEFSQKDISEHLLQYLNGSDKTIFPLINMDLNSCKEVNYSDINKKEFKKFKAMIEEQYFINKEYYSYCGNRESYDYENYNGPSTYYQTGFNATTLIDSIGKFYIIHPEELNIIRNINGDITGVRTHGEASLPENDELTFHKTGRYRGYISSKKMISFWKILFDYMYIGLHGMDITKTKFGNFFFDVKNEGNLKLINHNILRTLIFGILTSSEDTVSALCAMYHTLNFDIAKLFTRDAEYRSNIGKAYNTFKSKSDSDAVIEIINQYHSILKNQNVSFDLIDKKYISSQDLKNEGINLDVDESILLMGSKKKYTDNLKDLKDIKKNQNKIRNVVIGNFIGKIKVNDVERWCNNNSIDMRTIIKYTQNFLEFKLMVNSIKTDEKYMEYINEMKRKFGQISYVSPIKISLIFGFPYNFVKRITGSTVYLSLRSPNFTNLYTSTRNTLIKEEFLGNYLLYLNNNIDRDEIMFLHYIEPKEILLMAHIYSENLKMDKDKAGFIKEQFRKYQDDNRDKFIDPNINNVIVNYVSTIEEIKRDFINHIGLIKQNLDFLKQLEPDFAEYITREIAFTGVDRILK
jgi:hypothetical protein